MVVFLASCLLLILISRLWHINFRIPLGYSGDAMLASATIKSIIDNGWYFTNPFLGAPFGQDMFNFPQSDSFNFLLIKLLSIFSDEWVFTFNFFFLLCFPLISLTSFYAFRKAKISYYLSFSLALIYTFSTYHMLRGTGHLFLSAYYMVPLFSLMAYDITAGGWLVKDEKLDTKKIIVFLSFAVIGASSGIYYACFAVLFLTIASITAFVNTRNTKEFFVSMIIIFTLILTVFFNLLPSIIFGNKEIQTTRLLLESEIYGLKITQLLLPRNHHNFPFFASIRNHYNARSFSPTETENAISSMGIYASIGFIITLMSLYFFKGNSKKNTFKRLGLLNLSAVLFATIGGFSIIFGILITPNLRAGNRISVYIAFFSLMALGLGIDWISNKISNRKWHHFFQIFAAIFVLIFGLYDQVDLRGWNFDHVLEKKNNDEIFFRKIEEMLPAGSSVFQLPYIPFPEHPPVKKMNDYEHLRAYLNTSNIRWTYGAFKGSSSDKVIRLLAEYTNDPLFIKYLVMSGFSGIYINKDGYEGDAFEIEHRIQNILGVEPLVSPIEQRIQNILGIEPLVSPDGRLIFYSLLDYKKSQAIDAGEIKSINDILRIVMKKYRIGDWITYEDGENLSDGWSVNEGFHRWSLGNESEIKFHLDKFDERREMELIIEPAMILNRQESIITINSVEVGQIVFNNPGETYTLDFNSDILKENDINVLKLYLPDASKPDGSDARLLGIALGRIGIVYEN